MPTEPWWSYPPEVNAARILGSGPFTWYAASGAWGAMAAEVAAAQAIFNTQNTLQVITIQGATSASIAERIQPFASWLAAMHAESTRAALENKAVGDAYMATVMGMTPTPLVMANRAATAAAAASSVIFPNPALPILEAQYAGMHVQNSTAMTTYDTLVTTATQPRHFTPPPRLVDAGAAAASADPGTIFNQGGAQIQAALQRAASAIQNPSFVQNLQNAAQAALPPGAQEFLANPGGLASGVINQAAGAMGPAAGYLGQMAAPIAGVRGNGLAGAGMPMGVSPTSGTARGGLPLGTMGGSGTSQSMGRAGMSGPGSSVRGGMLGGSSMGRAGLVGGMPMLGAGAGGPTSSGRVGPAFPGVPLTEKAGTGARGPLGGMPMTAANQAKKDKSGEASFFAENVDLDDRYMAERRREEKLRQFR